ncbi:MAG: hypothetical protein JXB47_20120 [Anaerolineae bacterium]|nr:hypothetical protein [Anaerolineae bacterium]
MQPECPVLVLAPRAGPASAPAEPLRAIVEGPPGAIVEFQFHLLQATAPAARALRVQDAEVIFGYVLAGAEPGESAILARDAAVRSCRVEGGRCYLALALRRRAVYQPAFASIPVGGKRVFMAPEPMRYWLSSRAQPRWLRRLGLWLFAQTGWVWLLRLVQDDD